MKQYSSRTFGATYTSNGPSGVVVTLSLSKGSFGTVAGNDQNGNVVTDTTSTTDATGTADFLFTTNYYLGGGSPDAQLSATSTWCNASPVGITLAT